jgi:hypothetical protein
MWIQLAILVVAAILSYALTPKPKTPPPDTLSDVSVPTIEVGKPIGVAFGEVWVDDSNILWYGDLGSNGNTGPPSGPATFSTGVS